MVLSPPLRLGRCNLGRETALQKVDWNDGDWPRIAGGGNAPRLEVPAPDLPAHPFPPDIEHDDFDESTLGLHWQTVRIPHDESWLSDDYCSGLSFTGTFIALCAQDLSGTRKHADFDSFNYRERTP